MTLFAAEAGIARDVSARLRFAHATRDRLVGSALADTVADLSMSDAAARAAVYRHGSRAVTDALYRRWAEAPERAADARRLIGLVRDWSPPRLPVGGRQLAKLGVEPGPKTGRLLKAFEEGWIADDFPSEGHAERLAALVNPPRG
jgi:poly(A) polymerase